VLIAEDERTLRNALASFLDGEDGIELVAAASDAEEAVELAAQHRPDVALLDVRMPGGGGPAAARGIRSASPQTRVVALSAYNDRASVLEMLRAGASGFLVKGAPAADILEAIFAAASGRGPLSSEIAAELIAELATQLQQEEVQSEDRRHRTDRVQRLIGGTPVPMAFQPIVSLSTGGVAGVEALARFDPDAGRAPDLWLAEADDLGLRADLELAALRAALREVDLLDRGVFLSVNASPSVAVLPQFLQSLPDSAAKRLVLEVTEHAPVEDYERLNHSLRPLRNRGVRLAIDDAGAGFASLHHIVRLAPDFIKLDMTLTRDIDADPSRRALATAMVSFALEIGATMIAEGIETVAEFRTLRSLGIGLGQGFFLGVPGPLPIAPPRLPG
jgi:EAL domain-containing protein (putative c-di-GMP-specific phosphodiesterase class I)